MCNRITVDDMEFKLQKKLGTLEFLNELIWYMDTDTKIELYQDIADAHLDEEYEVYDEDEEEF